ncbi:AAA family ATPase [Parasphingorhabdus sp.]|uniref:AAA family ATPase n=1 Tax=Parasphingorhabdus sp. TaxID=2709688 RepID=UPI0030010C0B
MITRIEINGFKTFSNFSLDLQPLSAIVGPNASGKSNLFDALKFLSLLAQNDIRSAMSELRGEPEELFRRTSTKTIERMDFAVEIYLGLTGRDPFKTEYQITAQRLRYELGLEMQKDSAGAPKGIVVCHEHCRPIAKKNDTADYLKTHKIKYNSQVNPFIRLSEKGDAIEVRQDGRQKHGRPLTFPLLEASRTALSTVSTAEFPHLFALKDALANIKFLEINPQAARDSNDRFEDQILKSDASNLSAVLARLKSDTAEKDWPDGVLNNIAQDLSSLIPSIEKINIISDDVQRRYSFNLLFAGEMEFSSRVISDGTLRLLALLTLLNDPERRGTLCFEEPENGVHEGRIPILVEYLREAAEYSLNDNELPLFQVLLNTHSPKVMGSLRDKEIVAADVVIEIDPLTKKRDNRTRMRTGFADTNDLFDPDKYLTRYELEKLLQDKIDAA